MSRGSGRLHGTQRAQHPTRRGSPDGAGPVPPGLHPATCRLICAAVAMALMCVLAATAGAQTGKHEHASKTGSLRVAVAGLPPGQPAHIVLTRAGARSVTLRPRSGKARVARRLTAGRWTVTVRPVVARKRTGVIRRGARVMPVRSKFKVTVKPRRVTRTTAKYGTIRNPRVGRAPAAIAGVVGEPNAPRELIVPRHAARPVGSIITSTATAQLPEGLVARVVRIRSDGAQRHLILKNVPLTDAFPVIQYDGQLFEPSGDGGVAKRSFEQFNGLEADMRLISSDCGFTGSLDYSGKVSLGSPRVTVNINANPFSGGPSADIRVVSRPSLSATLKASAGVQCEKELVAPTAKAAIPVMGVPVPVFISMPVAIRIEATMKTEATAGISWNQTIGMRTRRAGIATVPVAIFDANSPSATINVTTTPQVTIAPSLGFEVGVGVRNIGDLKVVQQTELPFSVTNRECSWDWRLTGFRAEGTIGIATLRGPEGFAKEHRLWTGCGDSTFGDAPAAPTPVAPADPLPRYVWYTAMVDWEGKIRPTEFKTGPSNGSPYMSELVWSEWSHTRAVATGIGSFSPIEGDLWDPADWRRGPVTVILSNPQHCEFNPRPYKVFMRYQWISEFETVTGDVLCRAPYT